MQKRILAFLLLCLVAAPAGAIEINGQLKHADLENLASDPSSPAEGRIYINTTSHKAKYRANSAWLTIVDTTHALLSVMTTTGDIIYSSDNSGTPARLAAGASGTVLHGGTTPSYSQVVNADVSSSAAVARSKLASGSNSHVLINDGSGVMSSEAQLAVSRGGTGLGSGTSGGVPYYSGSTTIASSAALASNGVVYGGGAGSSPVSATAGTADQVLVTPHAGGAPVMGQVDISKSAAVTGALGAANGGTGVANNAASTLTISGNFATTLTVSGITGITLPTSGTLLANSRTINTTAPITGGGDLSADRTIAIPAADGTHNGYLTSTDWTSFNSVTSGSVPSSRTISTTSPLTGGGDLSANRTIAIPAGTSSANGYLASGDWTTFNQLADVSTAGRVSTTTQTFNGVKTFDDGLAFTQTNTSATNAAMTGTTQSHYEEGTWTPKLDTGGTRGTPNGVTSVGTFTRIGRVVLIRGYLQWTSWSGSPTGSLRISDLPFTSSATTTNISSVTLGGNSITMPASTTYMWGEIAANKAYILVEAGGNGIGESDVLCASNTSSTTRWIEIGGSYEVD